MLKFEYRGGLIAAIRIDTFPICTLEESGKIFWISAECNSEELRQIANKLDELNGMNK